MTSFGHFERFHWHPVSSEMIRFLVDTDLEMDHYSRWSKWPPLAATQTVTTLLMCSCGNSPQSVCKVTFNSSIVLGFSWVYGASPAWRSSCVRSVASNLESLRPTILFNEPRTVHSQPVLCDALRISWSDVLPEDEAWTACVAIVPMMVTSSNYSKGQFPTLYSHLSIKNGSFQYHQHTTGKNIQNAQRYT